MRSSLTVLGLLLVLSLSLASNRTEERRRDGSKSSSLCSSLPLHSFNYRVLLSLLYCPVSKPGVYRYLMYSMMYSMMYSTSTGTSSTSTYGTCYTASECSTKGGSADGNCAAGFGVCCVIATTTCGATISTNTTYIRNTGYPSSFTPTSASTCTFNIIKVSSDICQLRLDFQTFSGFALATTPVSTCADTFVGEIVKINL